MIEEDPSSHLPQMCVLSHSRIFATPWTVTYQVLLSMGFPGVEIYWSGLPFPSPPSDQTHISWISCTGRRMLYH